MSIFSTLGGAAVGFLTGGPVGAVIGGVSGAMSGGSASRTTSSSGSHNSTSTRSVDLNPYSRREAGIVGQSERGIAELQGGASPEDLDARRQEAYDRLYGLSSDRINEASRAAGERDYGNRARRGAASGSAGIRTDQQRSAMTQRELGTASNQAALSAEDLVARDEQMRLQNIESYRATLRDMWRKRLEGSSITTTNQGTSSGSAVTPDTTMPSLAAGMGNALTDDSSWLNTNLLGGGDNSAQIATAQAYQKANPWGRT